VRLNLPASIFSLNSFAAAMLALFIGFSLDLPRPYWAMLTVYITAQPLSGSLRSKAFYRLLGTSLGGVAAVALVPNLVARPLVLSLALGLWVGFCLYVSLLDRTPRSYIFLLAGYTAAIIGFPSVGAPQQIFDIALSRVEEISLGIVCTTFVHTVFFPRSVLAVLNQKVAAVMRDVQSWPADVWAPDILAGERTIPLDKSRRRVAADVTELQILATHLPFDTANFVPTLDAVRAMQDRLALLLPLASAVEDRRRALVAIEPMGPECIALVSRVRDWIGAEPPSSRDEALALRQACEAAVPELGPRSTWPTLLRASLYGRLAELIEAIQDARELAAHLRAPERPLPPPLTERLGRSRNRSLHRDHGLAMLSAFAVFVAIFGGCLVWIFTAWPDGALAPVGASIFGSFFAAQDDPVPFISGFLKLTVVAFPITALYQFAILPAIDGFVMLALALAPLLLLLGYFQGQPKTAPIALPLLLGFNNLLAVQEVFAADFAAFVNTFIGLIGGTWAALIAMRLLRSIGADVTARRILRAGWRDLASNAASPPPGRIGRVIWISRMLDRVGLLVPRLQMVERPEKLVGADPLNDLRVGVNVVDLQEARLVVGPKAEQALGGLLGEIAAHFRKLDVGRRFAPPFSVLGRIDGAIGEVAAAPASSEQRNCLWSLAGLRRNLFPDAPPYVPLEAEA
jgi:uncharacterized membrane protein YccC